MLGSGYGVSATCPDREAALTVPVALTGPEALRVIADNGGYPARLDSQSLYFEAAPAEDRDMPTATFEAGFEHALPEKVNDQWAEVTTAMANELITAYTGQGTTADALANPRSRFAQ